MHVAHSPDERSGFMHRMSRPCETRALRISLSSMAALVVTLGLAGLMHQLITQQGQPTVSAAPIGPFGVQRIEWDSVPPPPPPSNEVPDPPSTTAAPSVPTNPLRQLVPSTPVLSPTNPVWSTGPAIPMQAFPPSEGSGGATRRSPIPPIYPVEALRAGIEGHVRVRYTIASNGQVTNIRFIEARPRGVFEASVRQSLMRASFVPATSAGLPIATEAEELYEFKMD